MAGITEGTRITVIPGAEFTLIRVSAFIGKSTGDVEDRRLRLSKGVAKALHRIYDFM